MTPIDASPTYLGIDVCKEKLDLGIDGQESISTFPNDAAGIAQLVEAMR
jgi:hypothetical protein